MPTTAELDRLNVLTERLAPLARAAPGELILAEHWNQLVGVVAELARALLARDHDVRPAEHEHVDQVSLGWLEPSLRALIQRGPLSDPAAEGRIAALDRRIDRIGRRSDGLGGELHELRGSLDTVATRDLVRAAQLTETQRAVESQTSTTDDVQALRKTLRALEVDVRTAVEVGRRLEVAGVQFDPAALIERVSAVEELRERLRRPDGALFDASGLELRLSELTNRLVTEEELTEALSHHRGRIDPNDLGGLEERLRATLASDGEGLVRRASDEFRGELTQAMAGVDDKVARGVADATPGLRETLQAEQRALLDPALAGLRDEVQALVGERTTELAAGLRAELEAGEARGRDFATATATASAEASAQSVDGRLGPRLDALDAETSRLGAGQAELARGLDTTAGRIEEVAVTEAAARDAQIDAIRAAQRAEVGRLESRIVEVETRDVIDGRDRSVLAARLDELQASQDERSRQLAEEAVRSLDARVERMVAARVAERLADVDATIERSVKAQSEQARLALGRIVSSEVQTINGRISGIDARVQAQERLNP